MTNRRGRISDNSRKNTLSDQDDLLNEALPALKHTSLARRATDLIRSAIVGGTLQPGDQVSLRELASRLEVSPTPVREALIRLEAIGLVEFLPGRIQIASTSESALRSAFELREALEGMTARLAATRRTDEQAERIRHLAEGSVAAVRDRDRDLFRHYDGLFHRSIGEAAHSEHLEHYLSNALDLSLTLRNLRISGQAFEAKAATMHLAIADAITLQDADRAERLSREHVRAVCAQILSSEDVEPGALSE